MLHTERVKKDCGPAHERLNLGMTAGPQECLAHLIKPRLHLEIQVFTHNDLNHSVTPHTSLLITNPEDPTVTTTTTNRAVSPGWLHPHSFPDHGPQRPLHFHALVPCPPGIFQIALSMASATHTETFPSFLFSPCILSRPHVLRLPHISDFQLCLLCMFWSPPEDCSSFR